MSWSSSTSNDRLRIKDCYRDVERARDEDELSGGGVRAVLRDADRHVDRVADVQRVSGEAFPAQLEPAEPLDLPVHDAAGLVLHVHEHEYVRIPPLNGGDGPVERHGFVGVVHLRDVVVSEQRRGGKNG
jgi:hypothetical protein